MPRNPVVAETHEDQGVLEHAALTVGRRLVRLAVDIATPDMIGLSPTAREVLAVSALRLLIETAGAATVLAPQTPLTQRLYGELVQIKDSLTGVIQNSYPDEEADILGPRIQALRTRFIPSVRIRE